MINDQEKKPPENVGNWPMAIVVCVFITGVVAVVYVIADTIKSIGC